MAKNHKKDKDTMKIGIQTIVRYLFFITIPALYFYPLTITSLLFSILLAIALKNLLGKKRGYTNILLFVALLLVSIVVSGYQLDNNVAINNVINSQRGEHSNFQTNIYAKILHNKTTSVMFYLQNLSNRLSLSTIFASGSYPNLSKYLPLGFLFPWYLVGLIFAVKNKYSTYLNLSFLMAISIILILASVFTQDSSEIFVFSIIWLIALESIEQIIKLSKFAIFSFITLNLIYLGIFLISKNVFLNI